MNPFSPNTTNPNPPILLGVNIDHVATLRNVRGTKYPDPVYFAKEAEFAGADAITLHLREDRRHIKDADVLAIREQINVRMNLEAAVTEEMLNFACFVKPHDVCLVPERRQEITTEGGLDVITYLSAVTEAVEKLATENIRVSLFIDPDIAQIEAAYKTGARVIELHTGAYAGDHDEVQQTELNRIKQAAEFAAELGMQVNAGHGLHYQNTQAIAAIPLITELNIGHAIVAQSLLVGWYEAIRSMKVLMLKARAGSI